jgi:hypothetical protein
MAPLNLRVKKRRLNAPWADGVRVSTIKETYMRSFGFVRLTAVILASALYAGVASSQQPGVAGSELRAQTIVASFNKSKHVSKEKRGVRKEK